MGRIVLPGNTEVVVVSYGGVGTTFLLRFLARYMKTNSPDDADNFKHSVIPPVCTNTSLKYLYVYGNPQLAAISLFRRNYHHDQSKKLQRWTNKTISPIPEKMTLQEYAALGVDKFNFRHNFFNWYDKYLPACPVMFIRYETIFDNVEAILEFLELPKESIDRFPKSKKRSSSIDDIPTETLNQLDQMYGGFSDELAKLDDVEIRINKDRRFIMNTYLSRPYLQAFAEQAFYEVKELLKRYYPKIFSMLKNIRNNRGG